MLWHIGRGCGDKRHYTLSGLRSKKDEAMSMKRQSFLSKSVLSKSVLSKFEFVEFARGQSTLRRWMLAILCVALAAAPGLAKNKKPQNAAEAAPAKAGEAKSAAKPDSDLAAVLAKMNQTAKSFKSAQGNFDFETYQKLVDEKDHQQGRIYFRRTDKGVDAAFNIIGRSPKQVVYAAKDRKVRIYEPNINQITERDVSKNQADVEAFLSLGFGAHGDDLLQDYDVNMAGWEIVDGVKTAKLELIPKREKMRQTYNKILLWIDPEQDVLLQQQFFEPSGDYRLAHYTNMKRNGPLADDVFHLKTTGHPNIVKP
jgi:outer membrane lipoprotein-sorting protein